jgi:hypothetical protein
MSPEDERAAFWKAVGTVDDRVTELKAVVDTRNEMMREYILKAVKDAMPSALLSDDQHRWVVMSIEREAQRMLFRRKVLESAAIWAIPIVILSVLKVFYEYVVNHGWKP